MNVVELVYFLGFLGSAFGVGWLFGRPFGAVGWIVGIVVGLVLWAVILWCVKRYFNKPAAMRRAEPKKENDISH